MLRRRITDPVVEWLLRIERWKEKTKERELFKSRRFALAFPDMPPLWVKNFSRR